MGRFVKAVEFFDFLYKFRVESLGTAVLVGDRRLSGLAYM